MNKKKPNLLDIRLEPKKVLIELEKTEIVIQKEDLRKGNNLYFKGSNIGQNKKSIFFKD